MNNKPTDLSRPPFITYRYTVFGLIIESCIEIPELFPAVGIADAFIRWGEVPSDLEDARKSTPRFQTKPGSLLLFGEHGARILVFNGKNILVQKLPGTSEAMVRSFILGSALGGLLLQRGLLPIHASGIKTRDGCVMFCGRPGAGKSTIASIFIQRGYEFHADDLCVIGLNQQGSPRVYPSYPQLKLWGDTLKKTGHDPTNYQPVQCCPDKFVVPAPQFSQESLPIKKIFILSPHDFDSIEITPVTGIDKFNVLKRQTYRRKFLDGMGVHESHFLFAMSVGCHIPLCRVRRPKNRFLLNKLADILEKDFSEGE